MDDSNDSSLKKAKRKKVDPSFKSKRYRDKLRNEVKALESLIPLDRPALNKKLDSQTIYRLAIGYLRAKAYFNAQHLKFETTEITIDKNQSYRNGNLYVGRTEQDRTLENLPNRPCSINEGSNSSCITQTQGSIGNGDMDDLGIRFGSYLDLDTLYQIIDGFVMLVSTDGTVIYVTDSVSKYTGFNQIDLVHRCLYSVIHPQDHDCVRNAMEHSDFATNIITQNNDGVQTDSQYTTCHNSSLAIESFFCRIRCYHGNTSGFIKLHCSGKIRHLPEMPKTMQTTNSVALLYCQPFLKTGSDVMNDWNKDVFWSKHDLDLKFREIEETGILGYSTSDVCGKSLYQFVHPEDLAILVNVHKVVTRVTEVQTFFFRLVSKTGGWIWIYCKGKVICKNSKKFSIVFSHSPVRDEDNVFIKQEALIRRHKLTAFLHNPQATDQYDDNDKHGQLYKHCQNPYDGYQITKSDNDGLLNRDTLSTCFNPDQGDALSTLDLLNMACPSSLHSGKDRHSPVLPQNHAVQKILSRERQHCLAEYRRKQYFEKMNTSATHQQPLPRNSINLQPRDNGNANYCTNMQSIKCPYSQWNNFYHPHDIPANGCFYNDEAPYGEYYQHFYPGQQYGHQYQQKLSNNNMTSFSTSSQSSKYMDHGHSSAEHFYGNGGPENNFTGNDKPNVDQIEDYGNCGLYNRKFSQNSTGTHDIYSSANFRLSMVCNADVSLGNHSTPSNMGYSDFSQYECYGQRYNGQVKNEKGIGNCCGALEKLVPTERQSVKYDIEASVYMRIVEAQSKQSSSTMLNL